MKLHVIDNSGKTIKSVDMQLENKPASDSTIALAVRYSMHAVRYPIAHTKDRGAVRGGGIKPWRQKGTGRARAGSNRSPLWRGGGITFGPLSTDNFALRLPKKMRRAAFLTALSNKAATHKLIVIDTFSFMDGKTKTAFQFLHNAFPQAPSILIVCQPEDHTAIQAFRNLRSVKVEFPSTVNLIDLLSYDTILVSAAVMQSLVGSEAPNVESPDREADPVSNVKPPAKSRIKVSS